MVDDFILTLSDAETSAESEHEETSSRDLKRKREQNGRKGKSKQQKLNHDPVASDMDSDFEFQVDGDLQDISGFDIWGDDSATKTGNKKAVDIDDIVQKRRPAVESEDEDEDNPWDGINDDEDGELLADDAFGMGADLNEYDEDSKHDPGSGSSDSDALNDESAAGNQHDGASRADSAAESETEEEDIDAEEKAKEAAFFAPEEKTKNASNVGSFQTMAISRPILRAIAEMQFAEPTPIQAKTIPVALLGKDIVGSAVTGSGKTAAFMIPILERLLYRSKRIPTSRVAILMPTRELAVQCFSVGRKLASFTDITFCQLVGGFSLREQEQTLKQRPDVIIATPGRFIDHMRNSASFTVDTLEILVLDEADRMLEDGFADELNEILTTIPKSRQTMLFSATMTSSVDRLVSIGLNRPVRVMVDAKKQTVTTLTQEFVRLRPGREDKRLAYLLHLCKEVFTNRCIIFFRQKKDAHRIRVIFALFGFKTAELHGDMSQEQRITSVEKFRAGTVSHLLATDVAARGLDIKGVESVINYEAPQSHEIYLHRVGRTARAGRSGRACTLASETDRKVVKAAVKTGKTQGAKIVSRVVEPHLVDDWVKKLDGIDEEVEAVLKEEKEQKELASAEMQVRKGENLIDHEDEIMSRPKRTWFESEKDKKAAKQKDLEQLNGQRKKEFKRKLSGKEKKRMDLKKERAESGAGWKKTKAYRELPGMKAGSRGKVAKPGKSKKK